MGKTKLLFLGTGGVSDAVRLHLPGKELREAVSIHSLSEHDQRANLTMVAGLLRDNEYTACLFSRPSNPAIIKALQKAGIWVAVDLDDDFHSIPVHHPAYRFMGMGNPKFIQAVEECVSLADCLTVTTTGLRNRWAEHNKDIHIIPNGWSRKNPFWGMRYPRETVNIGWGGTITHRVDFEAAYPALIRAAKDDSNIRIVIAGDHEIYMMLRKVPEKQKMFVPMVQYMDWAHTLCYFDVLLAPLIDNPFNAAKSDIKLVDAGAHGIPYIASPVSEYLSWREGGLFASTTEEWYACIMDLAKSEKLRLAMGSFGFQRAAAREMGSLIHKWTEVLL